DEIAADDGRQDRHAAQHQRVNGRPQRDYRLGDQQRTEHDGGDDGNGVGLEQIGRHAGAVADVVADVVGDHRRIARVVFGNAGFDFADEVGADVGTLGE